jgi:hypothetical protein
VSAHLATHLFEAQWSLDNGVESGSLGVGLLTLAQILYGSRTMWPHPSCRRMTEGWGHSLQRKRAVLAFSCLYLWPRCSMLGLAGLHTKPHLRQEPGSYAQIFLLTLADVHDVRDLPTFLFNLSSGPTALGTKHTMGWMVNSPTPVRCGAGISFVTMPVFIS